MPRRTFSEHKKKYYHSMAIIRSLGSELPNVYNYCFGKKILKIKNSPHIKMMNILFLLKNKILYGDKYLVNNVFSYLPKTYYHYYYDYFNECAYSISSCVDTEPRYILKDYHCYNASLRGKEKIYYEDVSRRRFFGFMRGSEWRYFGTSLEYLSNKIKMKIKNGDRFSLTDILHEVANNYKITSNKKILASYYKY